MDSKARGSRYSLGGDFPLSIDAKEKSQLSPLKQAFLKLEEMHAKLTSMEQEKKEPVAVIGLACRFPGGADDPELFWRLLREGRDAVREIPPDRWDIDAYYDPDPGTPGKMYSRCGAFLDQVDQFDPQFFGIAPREALGMDPQQRLLLEVTWEALESAGQAPDKLSGSRTGVFMGLCTSDYADLQISSNDLTKLDAYHASGIAHSIASGRLSYVLGLQGPCVTLDTACSSSLVAVHLACQSLRWRECQMALAGGVNVILSPNIFIALSKASMLAADGRCKTFDASADGYGRGEGCGVVVLKRLSDALADGDRILALVRGSAFNQDGPSSGLTAPNGPSQAAVIREALINGDVQAADVDYVETHGTGTSLGDPIEVQALGAVYGQGRSAAQPLMIGAVKSNIGHLEGAAGMAGLIKVVLALQQREIPPSLHVKKLNPFIPWDELPVKVATALMPWPPSAKTRLAGVSAFGFSGTNAHIVLQEAPAAEFVGAAAERPRHLLTLSAKNEKARKELVGRFHRHISAHPEEHIADICYTANSGRAHLSHRAAIIADSKEQMREKLERLDSGERSAGVFEGQKESADPIKVAFLFTGQGSQHIGMGRRLYETQPAFRKTLERCQEILQGELAQPLLSVLYPESGQSSPLDQTAYTQPALFSLEYALAELWRSWGIYPSAVMGHSVGEYVAACVAGVFSLEEGLKLIAARGRLMQEMCEKGRMAAVSADEERVAAAVKAFQGDVVIAALNGPQNTVISGPPEAVQQILDQLKTAGIKVQPLAVSHAFHSPMMEPMLIGFERLAAKVKYSSPRVALISNLTGQAVTAAEITTAGYWVRHVRETVKFSSSMQTLRQRDFQIFLELGPTPTLLGMGGKCLPEGFGTWLPSLRKGRDDWQQMLDSLATLYVQGAEVDWVGFDRDFPRRRVLLPTYPFQRKRYWVDLPRGQNTGTTVLSEAGQRDAIRHPLVGRLLDSLFIKDILRESRISLTSFPYLGDHRVYGMPVVPATVFLEMISAAAKEAFGPGPQAIEDMDIREALILKEDEDRNVQLVFTSEERRPASFQLVSFSPGESKGQGGWKIHAAGKIQIEDRETQAPVEKLFSLVDAQTRCPYEISLETYHQAFQDLGMHLGPSFKGLERLWHGQDEALGQIRLRPEIASEAPLYQIHPALLDSCLQVFAAAALSPEELLAKGSIYMPVGVRSFKIHREPGQALWSHVLLPPGQRPSANKDTLLFDVHIFDSNGELVAEVEGFALKRTKRESLLKIDPSSFNEWLYELSWKESPRRKERPESPSFSADPPEIARILHSYSARNRSEPGLQEFASLFPQLEALSTQYFLRALRQLGWSIQAHQRFTVESKAAELQVPKPYHRLLGRMLETLHQDGILKRVGQEWEVLRKPPETDPEQELSRLLKQYPSCSAELILTGRCGRQFARAIKGESEPLELLFPNGSLEDIEKLYRDSPFSRFYNGLIQEAVLAVVTRIPLDRPIRILEIGAGTGSTTSYLLPGLPAHQTEYVFTDVTKLFISKAQENFADFPFVKYQLLDIEKDPLAQGFAAHSFDIVIAANVLHATAELRQTLKHVRTLLGSRGLLVLLEGTRPLRFGDIIVGLTEGWWKFTDTDLRPSHALLSAPKWRDLLTDDGFTDVVSSPETEGVDVLANQSLILARGPGLTGDGDELKEAKPASGKSGHWLILADRGGLGESLGTLLKSRGDTCVVVSAGTRYENAAEGRFTIDAASAADFQRLFREAKSTEGSTFSGVIYLWPLENPNSPIKTWEDLNEAIRLECGSLLDLVKELVSNGGSNLEGLWLITRGSQSVRPAEELIALAQSPVAGLGSTIALEHPELHCRRIDLDPIARPDEVRDLFEEIQAGRDENQIAFRNGTRHVARLTRCAAQVCLAEAGRELQPGRPFQLQIASPGLLDSLSLRPLVRRHPGPGEVEIEILATGLNFRDVLTALGRYPGSSQVFGYECTGMIAALGEGVQAFQAGDKVMAAVPGSFGSYVTVPADWVMPIPKTLNEFEAATIPGAFLTAQYALCYLGGISAGDRVLIHAAAGGVGLAAVQLAQRAGAEIFATAGSPEKRAYLKSLHVPHVMDSRSLEFAGEVMEITRGKGVNLVLNSLAGEFISKSLSVLAENGRFLEIGMTDIWTERQVAQLNKKISYFPINLAATFEQNPKLVTGLLRGILQEFEEGHLKPLPIRIFPVDQVVEAFRYMAQAKHIGKIVVSHAKRSSDRLDGDASYLITGGLAGLGLLVAQWMVEHGARHVVLAGRSGASEEGLAAIRDLEQKGAEIVVARGDVSDRAHLEEIFSKFGHSLPPLRGVVHSAGIVDDGVLLQQTWERFQKVMAPKVAGSWHLHTLTRDLPLDFFVLFSSAVSLLGSAGQGNHVAACAFEDSLAHYRRALGLPALSIDWGPWAEIGAATRGKISQRLHLKGFFAIDPQQGLRIFQDLLGQDRTRIAVMSVDWRQYLGALPAGHQSRLLSELAQQTPLRKTTEARKSAQPPALMQQLRQAPANKRQKLLLDFVRGQAVKILGLDPTQSLDEKQPLSDFGLDSLMAVELRSVLSVELGLARSLPATLVFDYPTLSALADYLAEEVLRWEKTPTVKSESAPKENMAEILDRIESLSEDEADRLYSKEKAVD